MAIFKKVYQSLFALMCIGVGLYPITYFILDRKFGLLSKKTPELLADLTWNIAFYGHIILGGLVLLIGWTQFSKYLRKNKMHWHRIIGKIYIIGVLISGLCGLVIATNAKGGMTAKIAFISMDICWLTSTIMAYRFIKKKDIQRHQYAMIMSYALCFSAVTLRIWLPILSISYGSFDVAYPIVAWVSWVPNFLVAMVIIYFMEKKRLQLT